MVAISIDSALSRGNGIGLRTPEEDGDERPGGRGGRHLNSILYLTSFHRGKKRVKWHRV